MIFTASKCQTNNCLFVKLISLGQMASNEERGTPVPSCDTRNLKELALGPNNYNLTSLFAPTPIAGSHPPFSNPPTDRGVIEHDRGRCTFHPSSPLFAKALTDTSRDFVLLKHHFSKVLASTTRKCCPWFPSLIMRNTAATCPSSESIFRKSWFCTVWLEGTHVAYDAIA